MTTTTETFTAPRIYVACLAAYNNGILHGAWIEAHREPWAIWAEVAAMLAVSPIADAEEYAIHDYEGFGGVRLEEYTSIDRVASLAGFLVDHGTTGAALLYYYGGDLAEATDAISDRYIGSYNCLADYAQEVTEASVSVPASIGYYIDWRAMARDWELGGGLIALEVNDGVAVFACG